MFTRVSYAIRAGSAGRPCEDLAVAGPSWAVVIDGATAPPGPGGGCVHGVAWLAARLGGALAAGLSARPETGLAELLSDAVTAVTAAHGGACDLDDPDSPSATVCVVRLSGDRLHYLVLGDSPVAFLRRDGTAEVVADDRLERLPGGRPYPLELVRRLRNAPGGFWVAGNRPEAAGQALAGAVDARELAGVGLFTDGVARLADWYGWSWESVLTRLAGEGPEALIAAVRELERTRGPVWGKLHDDATALWCGLPDAP
uniref:protein phosphatase 2C domain-containing protein n=1 Tax=Nonomuraea pusilla TaxID=46177 RepID=UPI0006E195C8|nr:protein phosphatase 2C domain-containing protein [Nonomuraea pusilla]